LTSGLTGMVPPGLVGPKIGPAGGNKTAKD
jgi:hypothetical protein